MKLKGHATIELTDVNTNEKKVYEEDNLVTNGISELLSAHGVFACNNVGTLFAKDASYSTKERYGILKRLTGGLLLFDSAIEEDVNNVIPPSGISLVGCASGIEYSGENTMAGSYNKKESGAIEGGYKHVWEFDTSHGNGEIACACLTSMSGGKITPGSWPYDKNYRYKVGLSDDVLNEISFSNYSNAFPFFKLEDDTNTYASPVRFLDNIMFFDKKRDIFIVTKSYYWDTINSSMTGFEKSIISTKKIDLAIHRSMINDISIFDTIGTYNDRSMDSYIAETFPMESDYGLIDEVSVDMPQGLSNLLTSEIVNSNKYFYIQKGFDNDNIYILIKFPTSSNSYVMQNEKLYVWKISVDDFSSSFYEIENKTGENIYVGFDSSSYTKMSTRYNLPFFVFSDYLLFAGYTSKDIYRVRLSNSNDFEKILTPDGNPLNYGNSSLGYPYILNDKVIILPLGLSNTYDYTIVYDPVYNVASIKNFATSNFYSSYNKTLIGVANSNLNICCYVSSNSQSIKLVAEPTLLVTINNLSSPVTKTASQTMKITYALTMEEE